MKINFKKKTTTSASIGGGVGGGAASGASGMPYSVNADGSYTVNQTIHSIGDVIAYSGGVGGSGSIGIIDDLSDVDTSAKQDGYVLTYSSSQGSWIAKAPTGGGGGGGGTVAWADIVDKPTIYEWATKPTKPTYTAAEVGAISVYDAWVDNWNEAYEWGDHSTAGYAKLNSPSFSGVIYAPQMFINGAIHLRSNNRLYYLTSTAVSNSDGQAYTEAVNNAVWGEFDDIILKTAGRDKSNGSIRGTYMMQFGGVNTWLGKGKLKCSGNIEAQGDVIAYASSTLSARSTMNLNTSDTPDYVAILLSRIDNLEGQINQLKNTINNG